MVERSKGGLLRGPSHERGGIKGNLNGQPIEVEGGEYIISKKAVAAYGIPMFDALNTMKFRQGTTGGTSNLGLNNPMVFLSGTAPKFDITKSHALERYKDIDRSSSKQSFPGGYGTIASGRLKFNESMTQMTELVSGANLEIKSLSQTVQEATVKNKEQIPSIQAITEANKNAPLYKDGSLLHTIGGGEEEKYTYGKMQAANVAQQQVLLGKEQLQTLKDIKGQGKEGEKKKGGDLLSGAQGLLDGVMAEMNMLMADPLLVLGKYAYQSLMQNERFQKVQERFFSFFMGAFDGFAEGIAIILEALLDMIEPIKPLFDMIGGFLKSVGRALTQVIHPFSRIFELLTPVLIYVAGFLQVVAGLISSVLSIFGQGIDSILEGAVDAVGAAAGMENLAGEKYKALNLLRQERDIIGDINTSIKGLADTLDDIQDTIFDIMNSALNIAAPGIKLDMATEQYNKLFTAATRIGATPESITEFQNYTKSYLQQAQDILKSSSQYQSIFVDVMKDLEALQAAQAKTIGEDVTETLKKGLFDLEMINSELGGSIQQAVQYQRDGLLSYNDLVEYIGYKPPS